MKKPVIHETHTRTIQMILSKEALKQLIVGHVAHLAGFKLPLAAKAEVTFLDEAEGSPSYVTGTKCEVKIVVDLNPPPEEKS